jgi:hypothetical protein
MNRQLKSPIKEIQMLDAPAFTRLWTPVLAFLLLSGCVPAELEPAWNRYMTAEYNYENCTHSRRPRSCDELKATYLTERQRYHDAVETLRSATGH